MPVWDEMGSIFKTMRVYLLGRGFLSLLLMGTAALAGMGSLPVFGLVAAGGLALSAGLRLYSQRLYEDEMTDLYREDIAAHLGMDSRSVTRAHLKAAAQDNEVIDQALVRQRRINIVSFVTSALAAAATFGLLYVGLAGSVGEKIAEFFGSHFDGAATFARYTSVGIVSGITSLVLHNGLEEAIGYGSGLSKAAAHDLIAAMDRDVKRGRSITPEQVYAVIVAENTALQQSIERRFKQPYHHMNPREQNVAMNAMGVASDMTEIAGYITRREVPPGRLAYMMHYARPTRKPQVAFDEASVETPARASFVERLGAAPREQQSYVERVTAERDLGLVQAVR